MYVSDWLVEDESDDAESDAENQRNLDGTDLMYTLDSFLYGKVKESNV
jgi:hypothetical protein